MKYPKIPIFFLAAAMSTSTLVVAEEEEIPFEEAELYFELNDTDGDLGIHGKIDGDAWRWIKIVEDESERTIMKVNARGKLRRQGLTELFFESAEPCFPETCEAGDEPLEPEVFFNRFPEGWYEIEGLSVEGEELESEVYLSQIIPKAPVVAVNGTVVNGIVPLEECVEDVARPVILTWPGVTEAHDDLGRNTGELLSAHNITVISYQIVLEVDETNNKASATVPASVNSWMLPEDFFAMIPPNIDDEYKFEVIVRVDDGQDEDDDGLPRDPGPGNQSAMEFCFILE